MKITRRSFVKKSSYSAAAVTVLGTGVGLGQASQAGPTIETATITITATATRNGVGEMSGTSRQDAIDNATLMAQLDLATKTVGTQQDITTKSVPAGHKLIEIKTEVVPPNTINGISEHTNYANGSGTSWMAKVTVTMYVGDVSKQVYSYGP
jgi:hypothetical protein